MRLRVGKWQVEPDAGLIRDGQNSVQVPPRLMRLLMLLVEQAGETVSRETLIEALWPRGYVNEEALSRAVNELRSLLHDDARAPQFIRTVPKQGYRLIAGVGTSESQGAGRMRPVAMGSAVGILLILFLVYFLGHQSNLPPPADVLASAARLTADPGLEWQPEISPNGQWIAQVVARDGRAAVQLLAPASPDQKRVITHPEGLWSPVFSPDSSRIAVFSGSAEDCQIMLLPVLGDADFEIELAEIAASCYRITFLPGLDWSPDGKWLVFTDRDPESGATVLFRIHLADGEVRQVTRLSDPYQSDERPRFSPDGKWLSFSRGTRGVRELWLLDLQAEGASPRQLTDDGQFTSGHDWWPDSRSIILDSDRSGHRALWRSSLDGELTLLGARDAQFPSVSNDGSILFQVAQFEANIWKLDLASGSLEPAPLIASTKYDSTPTWSPDGSEIAFSSNRTGDGGIWIASADGSRLRMVYEPEEGRAVGPAWTDGGRAVLATEYTPGRQRIVRIALNRREVVPLETAGSNPYAPSVSPDGQWIYYLGGSLNGDTPAGSQLWRMPAGGAGAQESVLNGPLNRYQIADDGFIYFTRYAEPGLWRRRIEAAGESEAVLEDFPAWAGDDWLVYRGWIYHAADGGLMRLDLKTGIVEKISDAIPDSLGTSISVHPDGQSILLSRTDRAESDLFLATPARD